ncbi:glycosyltransferase family 2 protein [Brevibacterium sp. CS2]|uniref:glycosyltransferase family 2 protein n=1 Tax=Brevibacterium sp. CS2 TaxID=2575923 RepID=UPI0010C7789A|nr:glycosyltransferase family 2 protein [Brevibacterium sp. CS2]QCP04790.1 glycosyltransferase family 2 protein [Brevibacterium sp. CS2]
MPKRPQKLTAEALPPLPARPGVSYIMPVLNEAEHISAAITTILDQEYAGEKEIVLALGPSTDETTSIVTTLAAGEPRIHIVHNPAGDTPTSLNLAIAATSHPVIVRVDAHSELTGDYTDTAIAVLRDTGAANCGGLMLARGRTPFQKAVARAYMSRVGLGGPAYHTGDEPQESESAYLGIYRREVFDVLGGFDSTLRRGQDWELNLRIREAGGRIWFDPRLEVTYWPRTTWRKIVQQFHATGIWRAELIRRHGTKNSWRYFAPPLLVLGVAASLIETLLQLSGATHTWPRFLRHFTALVHVPSLAYVAGIVAAAGQARDCGRRERAWFALVLPTMHLSWGAGFLRGLLTGAGTAADRSR